MSKSNWSVFRADANWYDTTYPFKKENEDEKVAHHLFYDLKPLINTERQTVNFVITTPENSKASYHLDLKSGALYKSHHYCVQNDVWRSYSGRIFKPNFTRGFIPRILDLNGDPQPIIVFGRTKFYNQDHGAASHRVRVVGGLNYQYCPFAPCNLLNSWKTSLLLVAVDPADTYFENTYSLGQLKKQVDWDYTIAFLQNGEGVNRFAGRSQPAYRVATEKDIHRTFEQMIKEARIFKEDDMEITRQACEKLYAHTVKIFRDDKEANEKNYDFGKRFKMFHKTLGSKFQTCSHFVAFHDIQKDRGAHWTLTYLDIFYKLRKLGYVYLCKDMAWIYNPKYSSVENKRDLADQINQCSGKQLDMAFSRAIDFLRGIKGSGVEHYKFVEYDSALWGTKQKLYSWAKVSGKKLRCYKKEIGFKNHDYSIFPRDVEWEKLHTFKTEFKRRGVLE